MNRKAFSLLCAIVLIALVGAGALRAASWSTYQLLNDASETYCKDPHCFPASTGGFHATYKDATSSNWVFKYRRYNGSLGTRYAIPNTGWPGGTSDVIESLDGTIWTCWENWATNNEQAYAAKSTNGGVSWTSYNLTNYTYGTGQDGWGKHPQLAAWGTSGSNVMIPSWNANENKIKYNTWNGSVMSALTDMNTSSTNQYSVVGVCRSPYDGSVYRCYGRQISGAWQICYKRWDGTSWGSEVVVSTNASGPYVARPAIAVNALNQILVVWDQDNNIYYRYYDGSAWQAMGTFGDGYNPAVTYIPGTSAFYCVYCPGTRTQNFVYGRRFIFNQWDAEDLVSVGMGAWYTVTPDICAESNGKLWAVW